MDAQVCRVEQWVSRTSLPPAAQRWLDRALPEDLDVASSIRVEQEGEMEIRDRWTPFTATGVYRAPPLSFEWRARFRILPGVWIVAEDGHGAGQGWGGARLWGVLPMGRRTDHEVLVSQMVRNLGELAWCPSFVLASPGLTWTGTGPQGVEVQSRAGDREIRVRFDINDRGDVVRARCSARPYDLPGGFAEAPWGYEFGKHQEFHGVRIPTTAVAWFDKGEEPREYLRLRICSMTLGSAGN